MSGSRILVVDDLVVTREGLAALVARTPGLTLIGTASTPAEAEALLQQSPADLALIDLELGESDNGIALGRALVERWPELRVAIYTIKPSAVLAAEIMRRDYVGERSRRGDAARRLGKGLHGYMLLQNITPRYLSDVVSTILGGGRFIDPMVLDPLLVRVHSEALTPREEACGTLVLGGCSNDEIAARLNISRRAVEALLGTLYAKFGIPGDPQDPGRRVLLAQALERWLGLQARQAAALPNSFK